MNLCPICGGKITKQEPYFLFHSSQTDKDVFCCDKCEQQMVYLMESEEPEVVKKAINYLYTYLDKADGTEIKDFLKEVIESNSGSVCELTIKKENRKSVSTQQKDYFSDKATQASSTSGWISGLKFFAWIYFIVIVIAGFIIGVPFLDYRAGVGIIIILAATIIAFLSIAGIMVFLEMAENLNAIKNKLFREE